MATTTLSPADYLAARWAEEALPAEDLAARQAIVAAHQLDLLGVDPTACKVCHDGFGDPAVKATTPVPCPRLRTLLAPYRARADFNPAWG